MPSEAQSPGHIPVAPATPAASRRLLRSGPVALAALARFALRSRAPHRRAQREASAAMGCSMPSAHGDPLQVVLPRVHELRRDYLDALGLPGPSSLAGLPLTFIHLTGTGEHVYSPLPGLERIFEKQPQLAAHRHLVVDIPYDSAAFKGARQFRLALRRTLAPVVAQTPGGIVLIGLSRGGVAAMDLGAAWAASDERPVGVIALSPPLIGDYERPQTVRDIAVIEPAIADLSELTASLPHWYQRAQDRLLRHSYLSLTCFTLTEFSMDSSEVLRWAAWDVAQRPPLQAILRANREFAMLLKVSDSVLRGGCLTAARAAAKHPRLRLCLLWGEHDDWVPAERCSQRAREIFEQAGVSAERASTEILPGWGHALSRELRPDFSELAQRVAQLTAQVQAAAG